MLKPGQAVKVRRSGSGLSGDWLQGEIVGSRRDNDKDRAVRIYSIKLETGEVTESTAKNISQVIDLSKTPVVPPVERPRRKTLLQRIAFLEELLKEMEWAGSRTEEDWQPDPIHEDSGKSYETFPVCLVCGERAQWGAAGQGRTGHKDGCLMGELCKQ
jgi:hypothetical protein